MLPERLGRERTHRSRKGRIVLRFVQCLPAPRIGQLLEQLHILFPANAEHVRQPVLAGRQIGHAELPAVIGAAEPPEDARLRERAPVPRQDLGRLSAGGVPKTG